MPVGGHTPFEPIALGSAVVHGPHVDNFAPAYAALGQASAARLAPDAKSAVEAVHQLLADPDERQSLVQAAHATHTRLCPDVGAMAGQLVALMGAGG